MARKNKTECKMAPNVPGTNEPSRTYKELVDSIKDRPLTNMVYAEYLLPGVAEAMDAQHYPRNRQRQHRASDIERFLGVNEMKSAIPILSQSKSVGFTDATGKLVDFGGEEAYKKAQAFNEANKGRVAYVVPNGDKFNVLINDKDARTQAREVEVNKAILRWEALTDELSMAGIDVKQLMAVNPTLMNPGSVSDFIRNLGTLEKMPIDGLSAKDIATLLVLNPNTKVVQNLLSRGWGTVEETAQRAYDILHDTGSTATQKSMIETALKEAKLLKDANQRNIARGVGTSTQMFEKMDKSYNIQEIIKELNSKYHLDDEVFTREDTKISTYLEATADAIMSLERQIRVIERRSGRTAKSDSLRNLKEKLEAELKAKKGATGLMEFLNGAVGYLKQVQYGLDNISDTGTQIEYATRIADAVASANNLRDAYYGVVKALSMADMLTNDLGISDADKTSLMNTARSIKEMFDRQDNKIHDLEEEAMMNVGESFIGNTNILYGKDLADIIAMKEADASLMDYLYSVGRNSNTIVSMMGALIRDAQSERDFQLTKMALEVRRCNDLINRDGHDSSFMYDDSGRIVSPYDWTAYYQERGRFIGSMLKAGIEKNSLEYVTELAQWEEENTIPVEVDHENHRFERMPNFFLTEDFQKGWSDAQKEYYDRMMELKGQIGTLLPKYAQHQFIAPQKRNRWTEIVKEGLQGKRDFKNVTRNLLDHAKLWKLRKDDPDYRKNGIYLDGEDALASTSAYDNTILRQIPIFYQAQLNANDELTHDFSAALQALASTALNYDAMDNIKNLAEMISDFAGRQNPVERDVDGQLKVDVSDSVVGQKVVTLLRKVAADTKVSSMLDAFVLKHIYGVEHRKEGKWAVFCSNLIKYTSVKGLAVNMKGAITNKYVGVIQSIIAATGGQYFNMKELLQAEGILLGEQGASTFGMITGGMLGGAGGAVVGAAIGTAIGARGMYGKFMDIVTNNKNSKDSLIAEFFDQAQESFSDLADTAYHQTVFGRLHEAASPMAMYQRGEYWIHMLNTYAVLLHEKVIQYDKDTGRRKIIPLYKALEKGNRINNNSELMLKEGIFKMDGTKINGLEDNYFKEIKRRIRYVNQQCHGSMNKEDKGLLHQWMLGKMTMNFRQWMVEHYSRRFRGLHWDESIRDVNLSNFYNQVAEVRLHDKKVKLIDALEMVDSGTGDGSFTYKIKNGATTLTGETLTDEAINKMLEQYAEDAGWRRGFKSDAFKVLFDYFKEWKEYNTKVSAYWDQLSETQKADARQVVGEGVMLMALAGLSACMGDPDKHKGEFWYRLWLYVVKRCLFDEKAATIPGAIIEAKTIINNPIASTQTVAGLLYPILGVMDIGETIQSGRYKGWNKYARNVVKYTIPFYSQIDQLINIGTESGVFQTFDNQITR